MVADREIRTEPKPSCYLCNECGRVLYEGLEDRLFSAPGTWTLKECANKACRLIWLDPMPTEEDIGRLYLNYITHEVPVSLETSRSSYGKELKDAVLGHAFGYKERIPQGLVGLIGWLLAQSRPVRERISRHLMWLNGKHPGRLLDVGCGNGGYISWMRELGWDVVGFEPDTEAARLGRDKYNLKVYSATLEDLALSEGAFDAMTMRHVIEHLPDPVQTLKLAGSLLKNGGHIMIVTPNSASLGHRWFGENWFPLETPRHLFLYNAQTLSRVVQSAGLRVDRVWTYGGTAVSMWGRSSAIKSGSKSVSKLGRRETLIFEHLALVWPFCLFCKEELVLMGVKSE